MGPKACNQQNLDINKTAEQVNPFLLQIYCTKKKENEKEKAQY